VAGPQETAQVEPHGGDGLSETPEGVWPWPGDRRHDTWAAARTQHGPVSTARSPSVWPVLPPLDRPASPRESHGHRGSAAAGPRRAARGARGVPSLSRVVCGAGLMHAPACGGLAADGDRANAMAEARHLMAVRAGGGHLCAPPPGPHAGPPGASGRGPSVCRRPHRCGPLHAHPAGSGAVGHLPPCASPEKRMRPRRIRVCPEWRFLKPPVHFLHVFSP